MKQKLILLLFALQMILPLSIWADGETYYSDFSYSYNGVSYKVSFVDREAYADGLADYRNMTDVKIQGFSLKGSDIYAIKKIATNVRLEMGGEDVDPDKTYSFKATMIWQGFKNSAVTSVQMENTVTTIMPDAFMSCAGMKSIQLSSGISEIPQNCFKGCSKLSGITISANIKTIGYEAFRACSSLTTVSISYGLQTIAEGAFDSCSGLESIELPNSVSEVGAGAFTDCRSLESIVISDNLKQIATTTFLGCEKLSAVLFGENSQLEKIGMMAFADCNSLKEFNMPDKLKTLESSNMGSSPFGKSAYDYTGDPIEKLKISDAISASSLSTMMSEIKGTLTTVTFGKKPTLKNLDILKGCEKLQSVEIPASITSLSTNTFYYAQNLKEINSNIESPFTISNDVFNSNTYNTAILYVPVGCKTTYKNTTGWKNFKTIQVFGGDETDDAVVLTANSYTRQYGEANPSFEYVVNSGTISSGTPTIACEATSTSSVGTYPIVISKGSVSNNDVTLVNGTLTITKAPLIIKADDSSKKEGEDNPSFTLTFTGFENGETKSILTKQPTITCFATKDSKAGTYPITVSGAEAKNYYISYEEGTLTINEKQGGDDSDVIATIDTNKPFIEVARKQGWIASNATQMTKADAKKVTDIGTAFSQNKDIVYLNELQYFTNLESFGDFTNCTNLISLTVPIGVKRLYDGVLKGFSECDALASITVSNENTVYDSRDNSNAIIQTATNTLVIGCKNTVIPKSVITIGDEAFHYRKSLLSLDIPERVESIGAYAFRGCSKLASITLPKSIKTIGGHAFEECPLSSVTIPGGVTSIGDAAFYSTSLLTITSLIDNTDAISHVFWGIYRTGVFSHTTCSNGILYVPSGTKSLYESVSLWNDFKNIVELKKEDDNPDIIKFADSKVKDICLKYWDTNEDGELSKKEAAAVLWIGNAFVESEITSFNEFSYFTAVTDVDDAAFRKCKDLQEITLPSSATSIGKQTFAYCQNLTKVVMPNSMTIIDDYAFIGCSSLIGISFPDNLIKLGNGVFENCSLLGSCFIPASVESIGSSPFDTCNALTAIIVDSKNSHYCSVDGVLFDKGCTTIIQYPTGKKGSLYSIPATVITIGEGAFICSANLQNVTIPESVTTIKLGAFMDCTNLQEITISQNVETIAKYSFYGCTNLKKVTSLIMTPFEIESNVFETGNSIFSTATLYVPNGSKSKYQATAGWKNFKEINETSGGDIIVPDEDGTPEPYAALSDDNKTLTFYYDGKKKSRNGMGIGPFSEDVDFDTWTVTISTEWYDQRESISTVEFDASFANYTGLTSTAYWFDDCSKLKVIKGLKNLNTSNVIYMNRMFSNCSALTSLDVSNFNTSKVISMGSMFSGCSGLTSLDVSNFNIANVTDMEYMFSGCSGLTSLDVSNFNTTNVTYLSRSMSSMFSGCSGLTNINLSNFNTACVISMDNMFSGCSSLTNIDVSNFKVSTLTELGGMFYGCSALTTIYCDDTWSCSYAYMGGSMFNGCEMLKGAISFDSSKTDITYANPTTGYFTKKDMGTHIIASINTDKILIEVARKQRWIASDATQMTIADAESVKDLGSAFRSNPNIYFLDELKYFTGLTEITGFAFQDCSHLQHISIPSSVTSISFYAFSKCCALSSIVIPNSVTSIGACAFENCTDLTDVTIPENVIKIGGYAFSECGSLRRIKVDNKNMYYDSRNDCDAIIETSSNTLIVGCKNTVIPTSVTAIADGAFWGCSDLSSVTIPGCLTSIGYASFKDCNSLPSICIPSSVNSIGEKAFDGCNSMTSVIVEKNTPLMINENTFSNRANAVLYVPKGSAEAYSKADYWKEFKEIVEIEIVDDTELKDGDTFTAKTVEGIDMTFKVISATEKTCQVGGTGGLEASIDKEYSGSITIPETINGFRVVTVAFNAFSGSKINSVIIGNNVTYIDQNAFLSCQRLKSVTFPNNNGFRLKYWSFQGCPSLETITLPNNLTSMDGSPFLDCPSLTYIGVEDDNSNYKSIDGVVYSKDSKVIWAYPCGRPSTEYEIIDGTQVIGRAAFMSASKLEKIHIPNSVTRIDNNAFWSCTNLKTLILPPDLTSIPYGLATFSNKITEISIPNKVTSIGNDAFYACHSLTSVRVEIEEPLAIDENTFGNRANATLYVPLGSVDAYSKANYWKDFKQIIPIGDANGDGKINVADVVEVVNYLNGNPSERFNLDAVIQDGKVNTSIVLSEIMGKETTIDDSDEEGVVLYKSDEGHSFYCDGIYPYGNPDAIYFSQYLSGLNQNHFRIEFDYVPEAVGTVMVLSRSTRVLAINIDSNLCISIVTNNGNYIYPTQLACNLNSSNHLDLKFNNGNLTVNGKTFQVVMETGFDNELSSVNYSNAKTYKGWLKNIVVTSY